MTIYATERYTAVADEVFNVAVNFKDKLDTGELLTGTPTITEVTTTDFTIGSKVVNTAALTINGETSAIGQAVQCGVTVASSPTLGPHEITISVDTDATPAQTIIRSIWVDVV